MDVKLDLGGQNFNCKGYECDLCSSVFSGVLEPGAKRYDNYNIKILDSQHILNK